MALPVSGIEDDNIDGHFFWLIHAMQSRRRVMIITASADGCVHSLMRVLLAATMGRLLRISPWLPAGAAETAAGQLSPRYQDIASARSCCAFNHGAADAKLTTFLGRGPLPGNFCKMPFI